MARAYRDRVDRDLAAVLQRDGVIAPLEGRVACQVDIAVQRQGDAGRQADQLTVGAVHRQLAAAGRASADHHVRAAEVDHMVDRAVVSARAARQVDRHRDLADLQLDAGQAHDAGRCRLGLERDTGGRRCNVEVEQALVGCDRDHAVLVRQQDRRAPIDIGGQAVGRQLFPALAEVARQPQPAARAAGGGEHGLAIGRHSD